MNKYEIVRNPRKTAALLAVLGAGVLSACGGENVTSQERAVSTGNNVEHTGNSSQNPVKGNDTKPAEQESTNTEDTPADMVKEYISTKTKIAELTRQASNEAADNGDDFGDSVDVDYSGVPGFEKYNTLTSIINNPIHFTGAYTADAETTVRDAIDGEYGLVDQEDLNTLGFNEYSLSPEKLAEVIDAATIKVSRVNSDGSYSEPTPATPDTELNKNDSVKFDFDSFIEEATATAD